MSKKASEAFALIGTIDPQALATAEVFTDVIDMSKQDEAVFTFYLGDIGAADIVARVVTCDSAGNNAAAFKTATTLASSATLNDNDQIVINVSAEDLAGGTALTADRYIKGGLVGDTTTVFACASVHGYNFKNGPASDNDLASVVELEYDKD